MRDAVDTVGDVLGLREVAGVPEGSAWPHERRRYKTVHMGMCAT